VKGFLKDEGISSSYATTVKDLNDYMFKVYLYGYIKKTIIFSAMQIKKKNSQVRKREEAILNVIDPNFNEERLNLIAYDEVDFLEDLCRVEGETPKFDEISKNQGLIKAIDSLTDRQKEIIYRCIIIGESDTLVASKLGITKQGVNKIKRTALKKMRIRLEGKRE